MRWTELSLSDAAGWVYEQKHWAEAGPTLVFAPVEEQLGFLAWDLPDAEHMPWSGTVRFRDWELAESYLERTSPPRSLEEVEPSSPVVERECLTVIGGTASIGPGGRVSLITGHDGAFVDVGVRPLATAVPVERRRDPREIEALAADLLRPAGETALRVAIGYVEPSAYEEATHAPVCVVFDLVFLTPDGVPLERSTLAVPLDERLPVID
ncbi:hypothetical protein ACFTSF_23385 [Kribbella sp. NPDC056951]|uniref:hypothetical protein n=1 Tax=Kribbella sp. NPDC056951 TaxID=3345978 RepID=UPI00363E06CA